MVSESLQATDVTHLGSLGLVHQITRQHAGLPPLLLMVHSDARMLAEVDPGDARLLVVHIMRITVGSDVQAGPSLDGVDVSAGDGLAGEDLAGVVVELRRGESGTVDAGEALEDQCISREAGQGWHEAVRALTLGSGHSYPCRTTAPIGERREQRHQLRRLCGSQ